MLVVYVNMETNDEIHLKTCGSFLLPITTKYTSAIENKLVGIIMSKYADGQSTVNLLPNA